MLSFRAFALLLGLIGLSSWYYGGPFFVFTSLLCAPILIVMGIGLSRERRGL